VECHLGKAEENVSGRGQTMTDPRDLLLDDMAKALEFTLTADVFPKPLRSPHFEDALTCKIKIQDALSRYKAWKENK
jgi:hypothetical protein